MGYVLNRKVRKMAKLNPTGRYVLNADEFYYIQKVIMLANEFYDDLISIRHEEPRKEDFHNLAKHLLTYSELHNINKDGLCNMLKDFAGIKYEAVVDVLLENLEGKEND